MHCAVVHARPVGGGSVGAKEGREHHREVDAHRRIRGRVGTLIKPGRRPMMVVIIDDHHAAWPARRGRASYELRQEEVVGTCEAEVRAPW